MILLVTWGWGGGGGGLVVSASKQFDLAYRGICLTVSFVL